MKLVASAGKLPVRVVRPAMGNYYGLELRTARYPTGDSTDFGNQSAA